MSALLLSTLTAFGLLGPSIATPVAPVILERSFQPTQEEVHDALFGVSAEREDLLLELEEGLQQIYNILPKNEHGLLGPEAVRYALHRLFLKRYGWTVRGLEWGAVSPSSPNSSETAEGWVPAEVQRLVQASKGVDLSTLAALAASLEDLVSREVEKYLALAYRMEAETTEGLVSREAAESVLETYFMIFLLAKKWTVMDKEDLQFRKIQISTSYRAYGEAMAFFRKVLDGRLQESMDFKGIASVAKGIGRQYHHFNDVECKDLKATLMDIESRKPGRVRLSVFYSVSKERHFSFSEKPIFLRAMGALDDSDPTQPSVIIPNYALGRINCFKEASELYLICCHDECQDHLMSHLEREIGSPTATPERIASLVSNLPSELVEAPRRLSSKLLDRLTEVAAVNGGEVPLHGRLFAQWMHHAYPLECPFPHEAGLRLQTPEEWIQGTGLEMEASQEEIRRHVEADVCMRDASDRKAACAGESIELPWSEMEDLFGMEPFETAARGGSWSAATSWVVMSGGCVLLLTVALVAAGVRLGVIPGRVLVTALLGCAQQRIVLAVLVTAWLAYCIDLLDGAIFGVAAVSSFAALGSHALRARSRKGSANFKMDRETKALSWSDLSPGKCV